MDKKSAIKIIREYISLLKAKKIAVEDAYLFGSYASGKFHEWSDIDVALIFKKVKNSFLLETKLSWIGTKIDNRIEPHIFELKDFKDGHPLSDEILKHGIKIK